MNFKKDLFLFLIIALLSISIFTRCKKSIKSIEVSYLKEAIKELSFKDTLKWIVILPGLGCEGCIQEGEVFMKEQIGNKKVLFILTNLSSLKILEQKSGIKLREHPNILIDRENKFSVPTNNGIYPCIIRIKDDKMVTHEFQCPKNGLAFRKLKNLISL